MFTKVKDDSIGRAVGTPAFMAPELCSTSQSLPSYESNRIATDVPIAQFNRITWMRSLAIFGPWA